MARGATGTRPWMPKDWPLSIAAICRVACRHLSKSGMRNAGDMMRPPRGLPQACEPCMARMDIMFLILFLFNFLPSSHSHESHYDF